MNNDKEPFVNKITRSVMYVSQIAYTIISPILVTTVLGWLVDNHYNIKGTWTIIGILLGVAAAGRNAYVLFRNQILSAQKKAAEIKEEKKKNLWKK